MLVIGFPPWQPRILSQWVLLTLPYLHTQSTETKEKSAKNAKRCQKMSTCILRMYGMTLSICTEPIRPEKNNSSNKSGCKISYVLSGDAVQKSKLTWRDLRGARQSRSLGNRFLSWQWFRNEDSTRSERGSTWNSSWISVCNRGYTKLTTRRRAAQDWSGPKRAKSRR